MHIRLLQSKFAGTTWVTDAKSDYGHFIPSRSSFPVAIMAFLHCPPSLSEPTVVVNPDVLVRQFAGELILIHMSTDQIYHLNGTSSYFWELVSRGETPESAIPHLLARYEVKEAELRVEVERVVEDLLRARLLLRADR